MSGIRNVDQKLITPPPVAKDRSGYHPPRDTLGKYAANAAANTKVTKATICKGSLPNGELCKLAMGLDNGSTRDGICRRCQAYSRCFWLHNHAGPYCVAQPRSGILVRTSRRA